MRAVHKSKVFVFRSIFVPILTYGHECWVMTERVRSRVQATKMSFLQNVRDLFLLDKLKSTDIRQSLNIKPLLLCIKRSQLRWYGHVTRMFHEQTAKQLMDILPSGKRPRGQPRTCWQNYAEYLAWSRLEILPVSLLQVAGGWDAWKSQFQLLLPQPQRTSGQREIN